MVSRSSRELSGDVLLNSDNSGGVTLDSDILTGWRSLMAFSSLILIVIGLQTLGSFVLNF